MDRSLRREIESSEVHSPPSSVKSGGFSSEETYLSDYVQSHQITLPELDENSADSDAIEEEFQSIYTASAQDDPSWAENWTLRKRNIREEGAKAISPPIGMLVPSPTQDIRTQIGDRNADEISDLSEAGSDGESEDNLDDGTRHTSIDLPHVLVESKTVIGGKNEVASFEQGLLEPAILASGSTLTHQSAANSEAKNEQVPLDSYLRQPTINVIQGVNGNGVGVNGGSNGPVWPVKGNGAVKAIDDSPEETKYEPVPAPR